MRSTSKTRRSPRRCPRVYAARPQPAARNGQRLAAPTRSGLPATVDARPRPRPRSRDLDGATPNRRPSSASTCTRPASTINGRPPSWRGTVPVRVYGPFRTPAAIRCDGTPAARARFTAHGPGDYRTPAVRPSSPGWYVYQELVPPDDARPRRARRPATTRRSAFEVAGAAGRAHAASARSAPTPGASITTRVTVAGLVGETVTVERGALRPVPEPRRRSAATARPLWTGTVEATRRRRVPTEPVKLTTPGYYTYRETIAGDRLRARARRRRAATRPRRRS